MEFLQSWLIKDVSSKNRTIFLLSIVQSSLKKHAVTCLHYYLKYNPYSHFSMYSKALFLKIQYEIKDCVLHLVLMSPWSLNSEQFPVS